MLQEWCLNCRRDTWCRFKYDRWGNPPCLVNWSERNWITLKLEWGWEREGHAGVIWLEQDAEKSNLLWSDSLKAKNKLTGGSLGSLAACSQYFIINDNKKKKGGRQGIWACVPFLQPLPPKHTEPALKLTIAQASGLNNRHLHEKGNARQDEEWVSSGPGQLSSACLNHGSPLWDSAWFIRTSATGNETSNRCSAG